jgi:hypothetical protein
MQKVTRWAKQGQRSPEWRPLGSARLRDAKALARPAPPPLVVEGLDETLTVMRLELSGTLRRTLREDRRRRESKQVAPARRAQRQALEGRVDDSSPPPSVRPTRRWRSPGRSRRGVFTPSQLRNFNRARGVPLADPSKQKRHGASLGDSCCVWVRAEEAAVVGDATLGERFHEGRRAAVHRREERRLPRGRPQSARSEALPAAGRGAAEQRIRGTWSARSRPNGQRSSAEPSLRAM